MTRVEHDSLGEVGVPDDALYGAQTARAIENFPIRGVGPHPDLSGPRFSSRRPRRSSTASWGRWSHAEKAEAIVAAADEVLAGGKHRSTSSWSTLSRPAPARRTT